MAKGKGVTGETKRVKDLMIPLAEYPTVPDSATLLDAVRTLQRSRLTHTSDRQPPRAVLITNMNRKVVGQIGHLDFLKALEPKYGLIGDLDMLSRVGVSNELMTSLIDNLKFWQRDLTEVCRRARFVGVRDIMHPITESIDEDSPLAEAIHRIVMWQTMRILVTRAGEAVGILRLADLYGEVAECLEVQE